MFQSRWLWMCFGSAGRVLCFVELYCLAVFWRAGFCFWLFIFFVLLSFFFFSSRRRHTRCLSDWSSDVCSSDLPNRRRCLELSQVLRAPFPPELAHPGADGTRADKGHLAPGVDQDAELLGQMIDPGRIECAVRTRQHTRTDLDYPRLGRQHDVLSHQVTGMWRRAGSQLLLHCGLSQRATCKSVTKRRQPRR